MTVVIVVCKGIEPTRDFCETKTRINPLNAIHKIFIFESYSYTVCAPVCGVSFSALHTRLWSLPSCLLFPPQRKKGSSKARMEAFARRSTFFATYEPNVYMPEDFEEEEEGEGEGSEGTSSGAPSRQEPADMLEEQDISVS